MKENMSKMISQLTSTEQIIICGAYNIFGDLDVNTVRLHRGLLPFAEVDGIIAALDNAAARAPKGSLTYKKLRDQIKEFYKIPEKGTISFQMYLNDGKVARKFGNHPELGKPILGALTTVMVLKLVKKGLWEVTVHEDWRERALNYLLYTCK